MSKGKKAGATKYTSKGERRSVNKTTTKLLAKDRKDNRMFRQQMASIQRENKGAVNPAPFSKAMLFS